MKVFWASIRQVCHCTIGIIKGCQISRITMGPKLFGFYIPTKVLLISCDRCKKVFYKHPRFDEKEFIWDDVSKETKQK